MSAVTALPYSRPLTRADLLEMPDDGHRYGLVDGMLLVSPAPRTIHQRAVGRLYRLLDDAAPPELEVFGAPLEVILADDTVLIPDIVVARRTDLPERGLEGPPVLAVEVLSPSTRRMDLLLKPSRLAAAGVPAYWTVDPDEPSLTAHALLDGDYELAGSASGATALTLAGPLAITVVPNHLITE